MKKVMSFFAVMLMLCLSSARAEMLTNWSDESGSNTGSFQDNAGSTMVVKTDAGPTAGEESIRMTYTLASATGYCGLWHNLANDLSKDTYLKFMAKAENPCTVEIALLDKYNVQYIANFHVETDWTQVIIPYASFQKNPYYTPSDAVTGHPMDLSQTSSLNFQPSGVGSNVVWIGPIESDQGPVPTTGPAVSSSSSSSSTSSGSGVVLQDFSNLDAKSAGTFQDNQGSTFKYEVKDNPNKPGSKYLVINYNLVANGDCGMWCRAGENWSGVDLSSAKTLDLTVYSKDPIVIGLALMDKNNNQYVATTPSTKGGVWETLSVPLSSFTLDPYYTPPNAIKGAPEDLSQVGTFNIQAKTPGSHVLAISSVIAH